MDLDLRAACRELRRQGLVISPVFFDEDEMGWFKGGDRHHDLCPRVFPG